MGVCCLVDFLTFAIVIDLVYWVRVVNASE